MATLKISELSVGDWVKMEDEHYQIYHLTLAGDVYGYRKVNKTSSEEYFDGSIADVFPIPITAEILEKNEIHRTYEDDTYAIYRGDGLWAVKYSDGDWELSTPPVCRVDIKYVHQLQHALRLVGVDKEIYL